jgi:hypothetical protein
MGKNGGITATVRIRDHESLTISPWDRERDPALRGVVRSGRPARRPRKAGAEHERNREETLTRPKEIRDS